VAPGDGGHGEGHGQRGHEEHEGADRRERDVEHVGRAQALDAAVPQQQVGGDQTAEEEAVRGEEDPHRQLLGGDAGGGGGPAGASASAASVPPSATGWSSPWSCGGRSGSSEGSSTQPTNPATSRIPPVAAMDRLKIRP